MLEDVLSRFLRSVSQFGLRDPGFQHNVSICEVEWLQKWVAAKMNSKNDLAKAATWMRRHRWHLKWYFHIRMWCIIYLCMLYTPIFSIHRDTSLKHLLQIFMKTNILDTKSEVVKRRWCPVKSKKLRQLQLLHCERPVKGRMHNRRSVFCLFRWLWLPPDVWGIFFVLKICFLLVGLLSGTR